MLNPTPQSLPEPTWCAAQDWPAPARPLDWWPWLTVADSLTERLRQRYGHGFTLQLLTEQRAVFTSADAALLQGGKQGVCREVTLNYRDIPLVFAHTLLPDEALAAQPALQTLGHTPLGDAVFNGAHSAARMQMEIASLSAQHALYQAALAHVADLPAQLWARRSVLQFAGHRVLIYEVFLPALLEDVRHDI